MRANTFRVCVAAGSNRKAEELDFLLQDGCCPVMDAPKPTSGGLLSQAKDVCEEGLGMTPLWRSPLTQARSVGLKVHAEAQLRTFSPSPDVLSTES